MQRDTVRCDRINDALVENNLEGLICRLPDNLLLLTGYYPMCGFGFAVYSMYGEPVLIVPEGEAEFAAANSWVTDIRTFRGSALKGDDPLVAQQKLLTEVCNDKQMMGKPLGWEGSSESAAPAYVSAEMLIPARPTFQVLVKATSGSRLIDATNVLDQLRALKTPTEVAKIRLTNEIACIGLETFQGNLGPGLRECDVAAVVEHAVMANGTGYKGVQRSRAWAYVMSGANTAQAYKPFNLCTDRKIQVGDLVLIELITMADGFWSDLTRTFVVGEPTQQQRDMHAAVLAAQQAALQAIRPDVAANEVDAAARNLIAERGFGAYFVHDTGHGTGFRYHEAMPSIVPSNSQPLQAGMVITIEPGVYIEGVGGVRIEDNAVVTEHGAEVLSESERWITAHGRRG
jgi:Xaa-Pro dipeptidase